MENNKYYKKASRASKSIKFLVFILVLLNVALAVLSVYLLRTTEVKLVINFLLILGIIIFVAGKWLVIAPHIKKGFSLHTKFHRYRDDF